MTSKTKGAGRVLMSIEEEEEEEEEKARENQKSGCLSPVLLVHDPTLQTRIFVYRSVAIYIACDVLSFET